jgi:hypothetical protein
MIIGILSLNFSIIFADSTIRFSKFITRDVTQNLTMFQDDPLFILTERDVFLEGEFKGVF